MNENEIHGMNATKLAGILEYVQLPGHPLHQHAKEAADAFVEAERQVRVEQSRQAMQEQMEHISEEEWSAIQETFQIPNEE